MQSKKKYAWQFILISMTSNAFANAMLPRAEQVVVSLLCLVASAVAVLWLAEKEDKQ